MKYKSVSALPDLDISAIGFGSWSLGGASGWNGSSDAESIATVKQALECGINVFDTAPVYGLGGSERVLGAALKGHRDEIILASKCGLVWDDSKNVVNDLTRNAIIGDVERSLDRLETDHLDLLQLHWPDPKTDLEETAAGLNAVLESGKAKAIGVTNFSLADTRTLGQMVPISSYQGLYNLLERNPDSYHNIPLEYRTEEEVLPFCREQGMAFLPYSPLFQGLLTDGYAEIARFDENDVRASNPKLNGANLTKYLEVCHKLKAIADEAGIGLTHLSLAWLCENDAVTSVLCGAQHPDQIAENAAASDVTLSQTTKEQIKALIAENGL